MIDIAVIGAGRIGHIHATNLHQHAGAILRCIVDVSETAAAELAACCDTQVGSLESVLGDASIQAVVIASSTDTHAEPPNRNAFCRTAFHRGLRPNQADLGKAVPAFGVGGPISRTLD